MCNDCYERFTTYEECERKEKEGDDGLSTKQ